MKAHLLYKDRDFDWRWALQAAAIRETERNGRRIQVQNFDWAAGLPWNAEALTADLGLEPIFKTMARSDDGIYVVSRKALLAAVQSDLDTIRYRQGILKEALQHPEALRELYAIAVEANEKLKGFYLGPLARYPDSVLRDGIETMGTLLVYLKKLRGAAARHSDLFRSEGWTTFFSMVKRNLDDDYFESVEAHLRELRFRHGELISAEIGRAHRGRRYLLHRLPHRKWSLWEWWTDLFADRSNVFSFELAPRDEAGAQAVQGLRNRGIALAATALGQAADHVRDFFSMLRAELSFYVGCLNLHQFLRADGEPTCFPTPHDSSERLLSFVGLYNVALAVTLNSRAVGNSANADRKNLVVITGPNSGGKSTFLRSIGIAQLMMQCGMFVPADMFRGSLCKGLFTHFKREEDTALESGKFDEELKRMTEIVDHVGSQSLILFNESFAATNEREGSEIAHQIITALLDAGVRAMCVTHMYQLARRFYVEFQQISLFLRAGRDTKGVRTFRLTDGEPSPTSFGEDLYRSIFEDSIRTEHADANCMAAMSGRQ